MKKKEKIRVVFDARMINSSGIGTYIKNFIPSLIEKYYLILIGDENTIMQFDWFKKVKVIHSTTKIYTIKEQLEYIFKIPYSDVFISPHYNSPVFPICAKKKITFIPDVNHIVFRDEFSLLKKKYSSLMLKNALYSSDIIITISKFSQSEIEKYFKTSREIKVLPLGVDTSIFTNRTNLELDKEVKNKFSLPDTYLLFVGNVKPHKNLKNLLIALEKLYMQDEINEKLVIVGKKSGFINGDAQIFNLITNSPFLTHNVIFTDFVEDEYLPSIYRGATLFCFPSLYEGFGLPPLEAMACGCPTLVSNSSSLPEICYNASYYIDSKDINDICDGIKKVIGDPNIRNRLVKNGYENVQKYKWSNSADGLINIIDKLFFDNVL